MLQKSGIRRDSFQTTHAALGRGGTPSSEIILSNGFSADDSAMNYPRQKKKKGVGEREALSSEGTFPWETPDGVAVPF